MVVLALWEQTAEIPNMLHLHNINVMLMSNFQAHKF